VTEPDATRSFSMTLPLTDGANGETLRVHAQGFAFTQDGATARLTLRGGGRVTVKDIPTGTELDLLQTLELPASPATTHQLSADIELHQRGGRLPVFRKGAPAFRPEVDCGRGVGAAARCRP